jgi:hypothetical protein
MYFQDEPSVSLFHVLKFLFVCSKPPRLRKIEKGDAEVNVALAMGSSSGLKSPTGKVAAKKTAKNYTAATNNTAEEVNQMIEEMSSPEVKKKILMKNGIKATGGEIEPAWEILMQEKLTSPKSKKVAAGKKGKKVPPNAGDGAAEVTDEHGNAVANDEYGSAVAGQEEEDDEVEKWNPGVQMELTEHAAIREASAARPVVVPDEKDQGHRYSGGQRYGTVDLRGLYETAEKDLMGMGGSVELILLSLAGLQLGEMADLTEISTKAYEGRD